MNLEFLIPLLSLVLCEVAEGDTSATNGTSASSLGDLAFATPEYAASGSSTAFNITYALGLLVAIALINTPRKSLEQFQYCATSVVGTYFSVSHVLQSTGLMFGMHMLLALLVGIVAAAMSYNGELRSLVFSLISAYGTTYFIVLITRMKSILYAGVLGVVLFFVYLVLGRMREDSRLLVATSKAFVTSLGLAAFVNVWGVFDMFGGMHGTNATEGLFSGFMVGGILILVTFTIVFVVNYFQEWTSEKLNIKE